MQREDRERRRSGESVKPVLRLSSFTLLRFYASTQLRNYPFPYFCTSNSRTSSAIFVPRKAHCDLIRLCRSAGMSIVRRLFGASGSAVIGVRLSTHWSASTGAGFTAVGRAPIETFLVMPSTPSIHHVPPRSPSTPHCFRRSRKSPCPGLLPQQRRPAGLPEL